MRIVLAAAVGMALLGLTAWVSGHLLFAGPVVCVENLSATDLRSVHLLGNGFDEALPSIPARSSACVRPSRIGAESSLDFRALAADQIVKAADLIYLESGGGYRVLVQVSPDLGVSASYGPLSLAIRGWL